MPVKKPMELPFLDLPQRAVELIASQCEPISLVELAMCSKRSSLLVRNVTAFPKGYKVKHTPNEKYIQLHFTDESQFNWEFVDPRNNNADWFTAHVVDGVNMLSKPRGDDLITLLDYNSLHNDETMLKALEFLVAIYPGHILECIVQMTPTIDESTNFFSKGVAEHCGFCEDLVIFGEVDAVSIKYVLDRMIVGRKLDMQCRLPKMFSHPKLNDIPILIIHHGGAIPTDKIIEFNCQYLWLKQSRLTKQLVKWILTMVMSGEKKSYGDRKSMGWWKLEIDETFILHDLSDVIATRVPWYRDVRDPFYTVKIDERIEDIDCRLCLDFERAYDNLLVSIVSVEGPPNTVNLIVWNKRRVMSEVIEKQRAELPIVVERVRQSNLKSLRNSDRMHANEQELNQLKAENERLSAENKKLCAEFGELKNLAMQIDRLKGNF